MHMRVAGPDDVDALARLWYDGWQDAHALIVPAELKAVRTLASFGDRLRARLDDVFVALPDGGGARFGFYFLKGDELYQFYVGREARGTGVAAVLMADAERRLRDRGITTPHLNCAIGNDRAARFYEKCGWRRVATVVEVLETTAGPIDLEVWRYEKHL
jgi:GNAT superfamily N-acetyltransferase